MNYYNENDPKAAEWLRQLIDARLIPAGEVDHRSIHDVTPADLRNFRQCHFFAGIGGWPFALTLAGVCPTREIWTASCPCQPFSNAGKGKGTDDDRHLWPVFSRLVAARRPAIAFGEQVASKAGRDWFSGIRADLERMGYEVGGADLCAACVGAPHIRQRLFWVAYADGNRCDQRRGSVATPGDDGAFRNGGAGGLADAPGMRRAEQRDEQRDEPGEEPRRGAPADDTPERARSGGLDHAQRGGRGAGGSEDGRDDRQQPDPANGDRGRVAITPGEGLQERQDGGRTADPQLPTPERASAWRNAELLRCADGKARRVEPGIFPLADGVSGRVGLLRGYGNAIVPQVAALFIEEALAAIDF